MHHLLVCCGLLPVLDAIELDQPVVRLAQDAQGYWDFEEGLVHFQTTPQPDASEVKPARFGFYNTQGEMVGLN